MNKEKENKMSFTEIDTNYVGGIPTDTALVVVERSDVNNESYSSAMVLYGFDEVGMFTETTYNYVNPVYGFLSFN
jgi:hypothetical protein